MAKGVKLDEKKKEERKITKEEKKNIKKIKGKYKKNVEGAICKRCQPLR